MKDVIIYAGEDFALLMSAWTDDGQLPMDLTEYDLTVQLSTTAMGEKIIASTEDGSEIQIIRKGASDVAVNINSRLTARLSEGVLILTLVLHHKPTDVKLIAEKKTIEVKRSKFPTL